MRLTKRCSAACLLILAGCVAQPDRYAPPMQRKAILGPEKSHLKHFIAMNDPYAEEHFIRDVRPLEAGYYRWTGQKPTLQFVLSSTRDLKFKADFSISSETFRQTGPFHIEYYVNGRLLEKVLYDSPGEKRYEKPVPAEWLVKGGDTVVAIELEKVYVAEADKVQLGVTLVRAGFQD